MAEKGKSSKVSIVDRQLEDELRALGWRDEDAGLVGVLGEEFGALSPEFSDAKIQEFDFSSIGEVDESALQVTEEDLNDPAFEAVLAEMGWDDAVEDEVKHSENVYEDEADGDGDGDGDGGGGGGGGGMGGKMNADAQIEAMPTQEETQQRIVQLKRQALAFKKAGNKAEALKVMRQAKMLEEGFETYDMDAHVESVAAVAQQQSRQDLLQQSQPQPQPQQQQQQQPPPQREEVKQEISSPMTSPIAVQTKPQLTQAPPSCDEESMVQPVAAPTATSTRSVSNVAVAGAMTPEKAKALALQCKKAGDTAGAVQWLREAKKLESANAMLAMPATAALVDRSPTEDDIFTPLEKALNEAKAVRLQEAKAAQTAGKKAEAVSKFKEFKNYEQELGVLQSRRVIQGARPALFEWRTNTQTVRIQNAELADDQMKLVIEEATGLQQVMAAHKSQQYSINYDLGYPREQTYQGQLRSTSANLEEGTATFAFEEVKFVKRARSTIGVFGRKKATFELILHRGFFRSDVVVGKVTVSLSELLTKCELAGAFELMDGRKSTGAKIKLQLALRDPLETPETREVTTRTLVLGPWPAPVAEGTSTPTSPTISAPTPAALTAAAADHSPVAQVGLTRQLSDKPAEPTGPEFDALSEREKKDPLSVEHLESNDVFEAEIQVTEQRIRGIPKDSEARFQEELRLQLLQTKMATLVLKVQREELSLDQYMTILKNRIYRDNVLSRYLYAAGRKHEAAQVLRRMKIMQQEVQNVESGDGEEEES